MNIYLLFKCITHLPFTPVILKKAAAPSFQRFKGAKS